MLQNIKRFLAISACLLALCLSVQVQAGDLPDSNGFLKNAPPTIPYAPPGGYPANSVPHVVCDSGCASSTSAAIGATGAATPASANLMGVSDGTNLQPAKGDTTNGLWVNVKTGSLSITGGSYNNITSNASTQVKSGAGTLMGIVVNDPGTTETVTIYDNTSCATTIIGTIGTTIPIGASPQYNVAFATGLCVKTAGSGAGNWTVIYR